MKMAVRKIRPKAPNQVDAYVGNRVRLRRKILGLSQEKLGEALGITFQQVQKYEKGINRIGAGRLLDIAECLNVPISFFFPESDVDLLLLDRSTKTIGAAPDMMELVQLFAEITDPDLRKKIVSLVRVLSEQNQSLDSKS